MGHLGGKKSDGTINAQAIEAVTEKRKLDDCRLTVTASQFLLEQGLAKFFYKGLDSKYFLLCGPYDFCCICSICSYSVKGATENI